MATCRWVGASLNRKKTDTLAITGAGATNDTITLTIDNVDFVITVGGTTTTAGIATTVQQAFSGTTLTDTTASSTIPVADGGAGLIPQFSEYTATVSSSTVTFTSNGSGALAGKPITMSGAKSGTVTITYTPNVIAPTSQYHADQVDNYAGNALPTGGSDTLVFDNGSVDVRWGLDYATTLTNITKYKAYTGNVGLSEVNSDNSAKPYHEYRTTYLTCTGCTTANLEVGEGPGSSRFKLNTGSGQSAINIFGKGSRAESGVPCILWRGTHASNTMTNYAGDVGVAFFGGESATLATLVSGDGPQSAASTICGTGTTLTTVRVNGGTMVTQSAVTTATQYAGTWDHFSGTVGTLNLLGGTFSPRAALTITNSSIYGKLDLSKTSGTITFTNLVQVYPGAEIYDPNGKATFSAGYKINGIPGSVKVSRPAGDTITYS